MTTIAHDRPVSRLDGWRPADPWVTADIAFLGEVLVARGLCESNPASNAGEALTHPLFLLEPGRFAAGDLEVRWDRHVGAANRQNRALPRAEWAQLMAAIRVALSQSRAA